MKTDGTFTVEELSLRDRVTLQAEDGTEFTGIVIELSLCGDDTPNAHTPVQITLRIDTGGEPVFRRTMSDRVTMVWA